MNKLRKSGLEKTTGDPHEATCPPNVTEGSAFGAFIMLLAASGVAAISFFLASPDRALGDDTAITHVRGMRP